VSSTTEALPDRSRVTDALTKHFFLRVHMFVILGGTISVGLLTTKILLITHERNLALRYGVATCIAFAAFLGFVKLWLGYVAHCASRSHGSGWADIIDFDCDGFSSGAADADFSAGGGSFGGGGATGSWGTPDPIVAPVKASGGGLHFGGIDLDVGDDLGVIILVAVLVLAIALAAFW